jgi:hypothetical protein
MFEKEAEEYRKDLKSKFFLSEPQLDLACQGFKDGYNKANEWYYVKDGDLPKETGLLMSKTLLLVTKMKGSDCLSLALGEYNFSTQEFSYQHIVGLTDVIAWKEIVLPKESE